MMYPATTLSRVSSGPRVARTGTVSAASPRRTITVPAPPRLIAARYTSQQGRTGEGGEEETPLQENLRKATSEQQYGKTADVPEEQQPGFYHESRRELERMGAVVHEEVGQPGHHATHGAAPESGTEGRTPEGGAGAQHAMNGPGGSSHTNPSKPVSDEDIASAPESGTR